MTRERTASTSKEDAPGDITGNEGTLSLLISAGLAPAAVLAALFLRKRRASSSSSVLALLSKLLLAGYSASLAYSIVFLLERRRKMREYEKMRGFVKGFGIMGSLLEMSANMSEVSTDLRLKFEQRANGCVTVVTPPPIFSKVGDVGILHPADVQHILSDNLNNYVKVPFLSDMLRDFLGNGIFLSDHSHTADGGANWRLQRKTAAKIFTGRNFRDSFFRVFAAKTEKLSRNFHRVAATDSAIDLQQQMFNFTLDSIGEIGFGCDFGCLDGNPVRARFYDPVPQQAKWGGSGGLPRTSRSQ